MPRSREELVEALRAWARLHELGDLLPVLVTDLGEAADLLDSLEERSLEEREEFRVAHNARGSDETWELPQADPTSRDEAERRLSTAKSTHGRYGYRIQSRSTFRTPWTDVEEGTDG